MLFQLRFNIQKVYSELHLDSGMADGRDTHNALDNSGVWQRPDCPLTFQDIPYLFPQESFLHGNDIWDIRPLKITSKKIKSSPSHPQYQTGISIHQV